MRDVTSCDLTTSILGHKSAYPFFIAPAAMGRLAHPDGELCLARVARMHGFPYIVSFACSSPHTCRERWLTRMSILQVSSNSSVTFEELASLGQDQTLFFQVGRCFRSISSLVTPLTLTIIRSSTSIKIVRKLRNNYGESRKLDSKLSSLRWTLPLLANVREMNERSWISTP